MNMDADEIVEKCGKPYTGMFSIDLGEGNPAYAKWLLAAILYAKPMPEGAVIEAFNSLESQGMTRSSENSVAASIAKASWQQVVKILQKSGFTRYDFSTASEVLDAFKDLVEVYDGKLSRLYDDATDGRDLERRLQELGKGLGPAGLFIFLSGMRAVWPKADPKPTPRVKELAARLGIDDIKRYAEEHHIDLIRLETALCRYAREQIVRKRAEIDRQWRERYRPVAPK